MNNSEFTKQCKLCGAEMPKRSKVCNQCGATQRLIMTAKLNPCRVCKAQISTDVKKCPHCGAVPTNRIIAYTAIACVITLFVALIVVAINSDTEPPTTLDPNETVETTTDEPINGPVETQTEAPKNDVVFENDDYKISFVKFEDPQIGVTTYNLYLKVENNTDQEIVAMLKDGYANDTAITFMTGLPVVIAPGKNAVGGFIFGYNNLGFDSIDDITKLEFKFIAYKSDDYSTVYESPMLELNF